MPAVGELCCRAAFERRHPLRLSSVPLGVDLAYPVSSTSVGHLMPVELLYLFLEWVYEYEQRVNRNDDTYVPCLLRRMDMQDM